MFTSFQKLFIEKSNSTAIHFVRSIASGSASSLLDFITLILLVEVFNFHYLTGGIFGLILGTTVNYFISVFWIFNSRRVDSKKIEYIIFIFLGLIGGILNILLFWFLTDSLEIFYMLSRIIAAALVFIFNFLARKVILFSKKQY